MRGALEERSSAINQHWRNANCAAESHVGATCLWLRLVKELHFYAGDFDQVVIVELFGLPAKRDTIDARKHGAFNMGDKKSGRASRNDGNLHTWLADCREVLDQIESAACGGTGQHLNRRIP